MTQYAKISIAAMCIMAFAPGCSHKAEEAAPVATSTNMPATPEEIKAVQQNDRMPEGLKQQWLATHTAH